MNLSLCWSWSLGILILLSILACESTDNIVIVPGEIEEEPTNPIPPDPPLPDSITYLALGDSYTIGQGVSPDMRWPNQLSAALESEDIHVKDLDIIAQTGWTTTNLLNGIDMVNPGPYDMVSLLIGVNNQYQSKPFELYETEVEILLNKAVQLAGSIDKVFVVSIPDYGVTPYGLGNEEQIAQELDEYNAYMKSRCDALGIPFINITEISRELGNSEGALANDNLHPSGEQYAAWVVEILPVAAGLWQ